MRLDTGSKVTRLEVIDTVGGREYVNVNMEEIILSFQDNGRTLKIFVKSNIQDQGVNILC